MRCAILCVGLWLSANLWAACSPYLGSVVFNEVQNPASGTTYLELRVLDPTVVAATNNFAGWNIAVYKASSGALTASASKVTSLKTVFTDTTKNTCGQSSPWIQIPDASIGSFINNANPNSDLNFVLYDTSSGTNQIIDVLRLGNANSFYGAGTNYASCPTIESAYGAKYSRTWAGNGNKDWFRSPDGTGAWTGAQTANSANSICGSNDATQPAQVGLTKVANTATVNTNTNFTFTLYAQNPLTGTTQSNVVVTDNLTTAGLTFVSCAVTAPDTCTNSAGTVTWTAATSVNPLYANSTRSALLTVYSTGIGTKTNTITANTSGTPTASASVTVSNTAPIVSTSAATSVTATSAVLNGTVNPNNVATTVTFGYSGFTGSYTTACTPASNSFNGSSTQAFSCSVSGLSCGTTYYYRASGSSSGGSANGIEMSFATPSCGASFDAYETSYTAAQAIAGAARIKTHVASNTGICVYGGACALTVGAFDGGKTALQTSFTGPVKVEVVDASAGACASYPLIATVSSSLTLNASGETQVTLPAVANAYANARIRISYPASGAATSQSCSSDNFAIRPSAFTAVTATDGTSSTAGAVNTLGTTSWTTPPTAATPIHKAGRPFRLSAAATNASGSTTTNYAGTPSVVLSQCSGAACTASQGSLTLGGTFASGVLSSNNASYNDIGSFALVLQDASFSAVDAADSTTAERTIVSSAVSVGRFVPDHFDTVITSQGCNTFTYSGQPFTMTVTAKDASGSTLTRYANAGLSNTVALTDPNGAAGAFATTALSTFNAGVYTSSLATYTFSNRATAPSPVKLRVTDTDGVTSATGSDGTSATATEATATIVSGRLRMLNVYGSEQLPLALAVQAQYYDASVWKNSDSSYPDTCTTLAASNFAFTTSAPACSAAISSCTSSVALSASGSGPYKAPWTGALSKATATGSLCVTLNLDGSAAGNQCVSTGAAGPGPTSAAAPWLKYPWNGASATNPFAQAMFGVYKSKLIYRRENY
ncbi:DUF6701 domain-containing protein [Rhodoferax sp. GW822-FHT02A01]|uniref:DUF6701 domain-containing protein n=1 Tax=Rhodoferax sp. GW822-FHT02A01 TaxID=3141537 RepID=UPI00315D0883